MSPFKEGLLDFKKGQYKTGNPYNCDTYRHREYERGYDTGYFDNLIKVTRNEKNKNTK